MDIECICFQTIPYLAIKYVTALWQYDFKVTLQKDDYSNIAIKHLCSLWWVGE